MPRQKNPEPNASITISYRAYAMIVKEAEETGNTIKRTVEDKIYAAERRKAYRLRAKNKSA